MKHRKTLLLAVCALLLLGGCSKKNYPARQFKKQLTGRWQLVSQGGGFAGLPENKTKDDIVVEFTAGGRYRVFTDGVPENETRYAIVYAETAITGKKEYVIALKKEMPYLRFTVSDRELTLSGDHVDAMYFNYIKIDN